MNEKYKNALAMWKKWDANNRDRGVCIYIVEWLNALPNSRKKQDALNCWEEFRKSSTTEFYKVWLKRKLNEVK